MKIPRFALSQGDGFVWLELAQNNFIFPLAIGAAGDDGSRHVKPTIQDKETQIHPDLAALLIDCWSENAEIRPSIRRVRLNTEFVLKW